MKNDLKTVVVAVCAVLFASTCFVASAQEVVELNNALGHVPPGARGIKRAPGFGFDTSANAPIDPFVIDGKLSIDEGYQKTLELFSTSAFRVVVASYKVGSDRKTHAYVENLDEFRFKIQSERDGYLYLFYQDARGLIQLVYPNPEALDSIDNRIVADKPKIVPTDEERHLPENDPKGLRLLCVPPDGCEYCIAVVTPEKLDASQLPKTEKFSIQVGWKKDANGKDVPNIVEVEGFKPNSWNGFALEQIQRARGITKASGDGSASFAYGVGRARVDVYKTEKQRDAHVKEPFVFFLGIGIDEFDDYDYRDLNCCKNDVVKMKDLLVEQGVVKDGNWFLLTNGDATRVRIAAILNRLAEVSNEGDKIIVYWSGHGDHMTRSSDPAGKQYMALVLPDSRSNDSTTWFDPYEFTTWAARIVDRQVFVCLDTCYSGAAINLDFPWIQKCAKGGGIGGVNLAVLASCSEDQFSYPGKEYSVATEAILGYLEDHRNVRTNELHKELPALMKELLSKFSAAARQEPWYASSFPEDDDFVVNPELPAKSE